MFFRGRWRFSKLELYAYLIYTTIFILLLVQHENHNVSNKKLFPLLLEIRVLS